MFASSLTVSSRDRISEQFKRVVVRYVLGMTPDPETWPAPAAAESIPLPSVIEKSAENLHGWVLDREFSERWFRRRTNVGARAYRLEVNGEYDCGWELVHLAERLLRSRLDERPELVMPVPPAPVFRRVHALEWSTERLARLLATSYRPDLISVSAPLVDHPDRISRLPVTWGDLYRLSRPESVFNKRILLCDWRWEQGKAMMALAKLLRKAGAEVVCFAWME